MVEKGGGTPPFPGAGGSWWLPGCPFFAHFWVLGGPIVPSEPQRAYEKQAKSKHSPAVDIGISRRVDPDRVGITVNALKPVSGATLRYAACYRFKVTIPSV